MVIFGRPVAINYFTSQHGKPQVSEAEKAQEIEQNKIELYVHRRFSRV